jgi:hypothetical protein
MAIIVACNGVLHIILAMKNHSTVEDLLDSAMCALSNLCYRSDTNKELIVKMGGAKAVVDTLLSNFNNAGLSITGLRALGNLAFYPPNIGVIIRDGAVQAIVAGLTVHSQNAELIQIALGVLTNLVRTRPAPRMANDCTRVRSDRDRPCACVREQSADRNAENMAIMAREGAAQAIVEVLLQNTTNLEIEAAALGCLSNFAR